IPADEHATRPRGPVVIALGAPRMHPRREPIDRVRCRRLATIVTRRNHKQLRRVRERGTGRPIRRQARLQTPRHTPPHPPLPKRTPAGPHPPAPGDRTTDDPPPANPTGPPGNPDGTPDGATVVDVVDTGTVDVVVVDGRVVVVDDVVVDVLDEVTLFL